LCHFTVLRRAGATNAMLVTLIMPLTPIVLGHFFLGEQLTGREVVGALIIAAALLIIDGRVLGLLTRRGAA
jgi:drug/metabolite transporter (DMT)-like permease